MHLAKWLTSPDNRQFARSQVNRIWYHMMGRGLVNPVDDFRVTNPATHPELLERLTDDFIASGFDVRHLIRVITNSESYQLQSMAQVGEEYAHVPARRLTAEQLLDAQSVSLQATLEFNTARDRAVKAMGALAHLHRMKAFRILVREGPSGLSAGEIATRLEISPSCSTAPWSSISSRLLSRLRLRSR